MPVGEFLELAEVQSKTDEFDMQSGLIEGQRKLDAHSKAWLDLPLGEFLHMASTIPEEESFEVQSGITADCSVMKVATSDKEQNVKFKDQLPSYTYNVDSEMDPTRMLQDTNDASLENFFSRPIKIAEIGWGTGATLGVDLDPWNLYFNDKRVINRINNYNLLRAKLKIKVVINGNGFLYGRVLCTYLPLAEYDALTSVASLVPEDNVQASQWPHIFLDPTTSTGGEMVLPFFYHKNYLTVPLAEWTDMGQLFFRTLNTLKHANGATDNVTISVFAWAEDVSLSVLTSVDSNTLVPQMGEENEIDEANKTGMISGPATAVAKMSNAMSAVPMLKPYALATEQVANTVAKVAKQFGYCRPPETKNPSPMRLFTTSSLAVTNVPDTAQKLTVDDKQELSIDPRIAGLGASDPLAIKEIAKRESYLTKFTWAQGTVPETLLWNARVDPVTWAESSLTPTSFHFPACAMAAMPFKFWTGSMKFRFQVVCSAFHKGRIKIVYDPNFFGSMSGTRFSEYNINYTEVIDIADTQDFTIEIGNGQPTTLLDRHTPCVDSLIQMYSTTAYTSKEEGNGVLGVFIVNELTTPNSTTDNDIEVNVFVSMGDDFEVFVPDDSFQRFVFKPQMGEEIVSEAQNTPEPSAPQQADSDTLGVSLQDNSMINMVFTGESILSFRTMLKRYNLWRREMMNINASGGAFTYTQDINFAAYPFLRGAIPGAVDTATTGPYNFANTVLMHWVTYAFQGFRGSIRYKAVPINFNSAGNGVLRANMTVQRKPIGDTIYQKNQGPVTNFLDPSFAAASIVLNYSNPVTRINTGVRGMTYTDFEVNQNTEFEMPYYSPERFVPGKISNWTSVPTPVEGYKCKINATINDKSVLDMYVGAGEDFQVYMWTGLPRMYCESVPPAADVQPG
jgi:hypothetical protein